MLTLPDTIIRTEHPVTVNVRTATLDDRPRLLHLWQERRVILNQSDARFTAPTAADRDAWHTQMTERITTAGHTVLVGITQKNEIAGFISGEARAGVGVIEDIALDAHTYHPGLGRDLLQHLRAAFTENGITTLRVIVPRYHAVEQAFWLALRAIPWQPPANEDSWQLPPQSMWMTWSSGQ